MQKAVNTSKKRRKIDKMTKKHGMAIQKIQIIQEKGEIT